MKDNLVTTEIVEPYAQALMSLGQSSELVDRFGDDMNFLLQMLTESDEFRQFLATPLVKAEPKKGVLRQLAGEQVHPYTLNFLMLLVDRGRIVFLPSVARQYQTLLRQLRQTILAEVTSAVELTDAQKDAVRQKVKQLVGASEVELETQVEPDLIGGVVIKVGSQIFDASLRGQLRRIGFRLASTT